MYRAVTREIEVRAEPYYLEDRSDPDRDQYVWAYRMTIINRSDKSVRLVERYWHITDGNGQVEEVRGAGVVGEQPWIQPGQAYRYASGCPLSTPSGIMVGHYVMTDGQGRRLEIAIPAFSLDLPDTPRTVN